MPPEPRPERHKLGAVRRIACILGTILCWEVSARTFHGGSALYPDPITVARTTWNDITTGVLVADIAASLLRVIAGFALGSLLGIGAGLITARSAAARDTLGMLLDLLRPLPPIALVPLVVLWFGLGELPKIGLVAVGVTPVVWIATHLALGAVDRTYVLTALSLGITGHRLLAEVMLPAAVPAILNGLRTALGIAFFCLVAAEMAGAESGVAYRIELSNLYFRVDRMVEYLAVLGGVFALCQACFLAASQRLFPWINLDAMKNGR